MRGPVSSQTVSSRTVSSQAVSSRQVVPALVDEERVMEALPLIDPIARRLRWQLGGSIPLDDLRSMGHFATMELVRRFDPEQSPFLPYMKTRLRWAMLDGVRRQTHGRVLAARARALATSERHAVVQREQGRNAEPPSGAMPPSQASFQQRLRQILREHAAVLGIKLVAAGGGETAVTPSSANPERATLKRSALETVRAVIGSLEDERQRQIVERHYFGGETFTAIADALDLSKARVSRLHAEAIVLIEKRLRARGVSG